MWSRFLIERECLIKNKKTTLSSFVTCQSGRQFTDDISESFEFHSAKEHWSRFFFNLRQKIIRKARKALLSIYGNLQWKKNILCKLKIGCITWYMFFGRHFYLHRYSSTKRARIILKWTNFYYFLFSVFCICIAVCILNQMECSNGPVFKADFVFGNNSGWLRPSARIPWANLDIHDFTKIQDT